MAATSNNSGGSAPMGGRFRLPTRSVNPDGVTTMKTGPFKLGSLPGSGSAGVGKGGNMSVSFLAGMASAAQTAMVGVAKIGVKVAEQLFTAFGEALDSILTGKPPKGTMVSGDSKPAPASSADLKALTKRVDTLEKNNAGTPGVSK